MSAGIVSKMISSPSKNLSNILENFPQFPTNGREGGGSSEVQLGRYLFQFLYKYMFYNQRVYLSLTLPLLVYPEKGNLGINEKILQKLIFKVNHVVI